MWKFYFSIYFVIYVFSFTESIGRYDQICPNSFNKASCKEISKNATYICTDETVTSTDCILSMEKKESRLAIMEPEQSLLASALASNNVVIIGTISRETLPYQTAVIIRKPYNSFESLRGKHFCHPGYIHDEAVTKYVLDEFESKIISLNNSICDSDENITSAERNVETVSSFFASSCKPGPWTTDSELDIKWKSIYSNLCELCGPRKCAIEYEMPFNDTLSCLIQNSGDVALTTLRDAQIFFGETINTESFQYLCPNGTVSSYLEPCTWTNQLDPLIITEEAVATFAQNYIKTHLLNHIFKIDTQTGITKPLEQIFGLGKTDKINLLENPVPLKTFVESRRSMPDAENITCEKTVRWCTLNDNEQQKCMWLRQAAFNFGLQPSIECLQNDVDDSCVMDISLEKSDFAYINSSYGNLARQNGLSAIAYSEDADEQLVSVLLVIRNDMSDINHLTDLKGKRACFPEYGGKEWLAFIDTMRNSGLMPISCDYDTIFGDFLGSSCIPGAKSPVLPISTEIREKLCAQCIPISNKLTAKYCNADDGNKYYRTDGSLKCLEDQSADYAVISLNEVAPSFDASTYRVLCKNGSLARMPGFLVDREAPLTVISSGEIVARNDSAKRADIALLLRDISAQFAGKPSTIFKAFGEFDGVKNSLLPDTIFGLAFGNDVSKYAKNYQKLLENSDNCIAPVSGSGSSFDVVLSTILLLMGFFIVRFQSCVLF